MDRISTARLGTNWGWFLLRGIVCLLFCAIVGIVGPNDTPKDLSSLVGAFLLANGLCMLALGGLSSAPRTSWLYLVVNALITLAVGILSLFQAWWSWPTLAIWWTGWAFVTGGVELVAGIPLQRESNEWLLVLAGLVSMAFGFGAGTVPGLAPSYMAWCWVGYGLVYGITMIWLAYRLQVWTRATASTAVAHPTQPPLAEPAEERTPARMAP